MILYFPVSSFLLRMHIKEADTVVSPKLFKSNIILLPTSLQVPQILVNMEKSCS